MQCRQLRVSEWPSIVPLFEECFGEGPPPPTHSKILVATHEGEYLAALTLQDVTHVEPFAVSSSKRTLGSFRVYLHSLVDLAFSVLPMQTTAFVMTTDPRLEKFYESCGLEKMPHTLWRWKKNV